MSIFIYPTPTPPWSKPYIWRFEPLLADLRRIGEVTTNMSRAKVFLIANHVDIRSDLKVAALIRHASKTNPRFSWKNHFLMLPCDHGPGDCMFSNQKMIPKTSLVHPHNPSRALRYMMVSGSPTRAHFRHGHDIRLPVHMNEILQRTFPTVNASQRDTLFFWAGSMRHKGIRRDLATWHTNTSNFVIRTNIPSTNIAFWMQRSVFCASPPGWDEGDSNRYLPAIAFGCIPVFLLDDEELPFQGIINWTNSAVRLKRADIPRLDRILGSISSLRIVEMQASLPTTLSYLTYNSYSPNPWPDRMKVMGAAKTFVRFAQETCGNL